MELKYLKKMLLKNVPEVNEELIRRKIEEVPSILGLGDLEVVGREVVVPSGGRIDLLLEDPEEERRFIVELQLGKIDESHIIRSIEYWEFMKRFFPQYDYTIVLLAEDVSRFLNVISVLVSIIPFVIIQLVAFELEEGKVGFSFSKVLDGMPQSIESLEGEVSVDENYWKEKASEESLDLVNRILQLIREKIDPSFSLNYTKHYIGLESKGITKNFVSFVPRKQSFVILELKHQKDKEIDDLIKNYGFQELRYDHYFGLYKLRIQKEDLDDKNKRDGLVKLMEKAYKNYFGKS